MHLPMRFSIFDALRGNRNRAVAIGRYQNCRSRPEPPKGGTPNLTDAFHRTYSNCQCLFHHGARSGRSEAGDRKF